MSTLMSRDLNIERSSTRLHAPPGGKSSISFGSDEPFKKPAVVVPVVTETAPVVTAPVVTETAPVVTETAPVTELLSVFSVPVTASPMKATAPVSSMSSIISQEVTAPVVAPVTARRGHPSDSSIFNNQNEAPAAPVTARRGHPNDSSMKGIISQDEGVTAPVRRVRQAPGGNSSIIFG